jgi:hypothetical protein
MCSLKKWSPRPNDCPPTTLLRSKASSGTGSKLPLGFALPKDTVALVRSPRAPIRNYQYAPFADILCSLQFPVLACEALAPVLAPSAIPGRPLLSTPPQARRLRTSLTRGHRCLRQSRLSRSNRNRVGTLPV